MEIYHFIFDQKQRVSPLANKGAGRTTEQDWHSIFISQDTGNSEHQYNDCLQISYQYGTCISDAIQCGKHMYMLCCSGVLSMTYAF